MATVIDSLLIELGLDTSKFDANQKKSVEELRKFDDQAQKTSKNTQQGAKNIGDGFEKARNALISLGVAFIGIKGFTSLVQQTTVTNAGLARTAELFRMSAREVDAWGGVLKSVGGNAQDFQSSFQAIQSGAAAVQFGNTAILETLGKLQALDAYDYDKKSVDIYKLADAIKRFSDANGEQAALIQAEAMGINRNFFMILKQGSEVMHKLYGESDKLSGVTEQNTLKAQKLQEQWGRVEQALSGAGNQIMDQMYPALGKLAEGTEFSIEKFIEWDKALDGGLSNATIFTGGLLSVMSVLTALGVSISTQIATIAKWGLTIEGIVTSPWFARFTGALGLMLYSGGLNKGEDAEIKKIHEEQDKREGVTRDTTGRVITKNGKPVNGYENLTPEVQKNFADLESKYKLPAGMLDKLWSIESSRGSNMGPSSTGATGHFQFMPKTAAAYKMTEADTYDLNKSSEAAAHMMSDLLKQFKGDEAKAIAAYNWGSGNVENKGMGAIPPETQAYLKKYGTQPANQPVLTSNQNYMGANISTPSNQATNNSNSEVNIQNVNVQTQATDAKGIAQDMKVAIQNNSLINYGMVGNR